MSYDPSNLPIYNNYGAPMNPMGNAPQFGNNPQQYSVRNNIVNNTPPVQEEAHVTVGGAGTFKPKFTIKEQSGREIVLSKDPELPVESKKETPAKKKKKKETPAPSSANPDGIIRADGVVEDNSSIYTYYETTNMLHDTLGQIDGLNAELLQEFENVRRSRTMKNKYNVLVGLSANMGQLINNRLQVLKEINNSISKSNELDYKREKDRKAVEAGMNDDKYIADLYKSFIQQPNAVPSLPNYPSVDASVFGSGIVRAELPPNAAANDGGMIRADGVKDTQYLNYMSNLTPEQNLMRYEGNPNVKQVVVFDAATGNRFFQMMDLSNGTVIPNVPVYDPMFLEDTTLDLKNKVAKNINLNETFPIVVINEGVTKEY